MRACVVFHAFLKHLQQNVSGGAPYTALVVLWPAILRFATALAALILRCGLRVAIWGVQNTTSLGAGWACDSQIAAG